MITVTLLGSSGSMPRPKRPLTSFFVQDDRFTALIDCGEGTQTAAINAEVNVFDLDAVFITHEHFDHTLGLSGLISTLKNLKRTKPLMIFVPKPAFTQLTTLIKVTTSGYSSKTFDIELIPIEGNETRIEFEGIIVTAFKVNHTTPCYGYKFERPRCGKFDEKKAAACPLEPVYHSLLQSGYVVEKDGAEFTADAVCAEARSTHSVVYCTDTRPCESLLKHCTGVDLAVLEAMYPDESDTSQALANKHSLCTESVQLATQAKVKELWLTHFSPAFCNPQYVIAKFKTEYPIRAGEAGLRKEIVD